MAILHLDFETYCEADLTKVGADVYARDPSLIVTVIAWAFDNGPIHSVTTPDALPAPLQAHLEAGGVYRAWNAAFEWAILTHGFGVRLQPEQADCTMQAALYSGLPASLGDAGPAIGAKVVKDPEARRLMLQLAQPRKGRKASGYRQTFWHIDDPEKLEALRAYCVRDVEAERNIAKRIAPLPAQERRVSILDRKANERGVRIDFAFVEQLKRIAIDEVERLNLECSMMTGGEITSPGTQVAKMLAFLRYLGDPLPDLSKETVEAAIPVAGPAAAGLLQVRQEVAKSSLKKLDAMIRCAGPDGRVRGQLAYYGAFRTGRFAGRLIQPQNFPRPTVGDVKTLIRLIRRGADAEWIRELFGLPLEAVASALRGCLIPDPGNLFIAYDLSQIEARVVAWMAAQTDLLDVFARGEDVYVHAARKIGSDSRMLGKQLTLACGYGMGPLKFRSTAAKAGLTLSPEESDDAVKAWRFSNPSIVKLWRDADDGVRMLLSEFTGQMIHRVINDKLSAAISLARNGDPLLILKLPSGRRLYYRNARFRPDPLKPDRVQIAYMGVDPNTKRWCEVRTYGAKIIENAVQAVARDVIVEAALRIDDLDLGALVLSVHDELVFEAASSDAARLNPLIAAEINRRPPWAPDLPVASAGGIVDRYGK